MIQHVGSALADGQLRTALNDAVNGEKVKLF